MKALYFDCVNGVSGDMVYSALRELLGEKERSALGAVEKLHIHGQEHGHSHNSYSDIKKLIEGSKISEGAKKNALSIYSVIAKAESSVHGTSVADVHFHEVGRVEAIKNIVGAAVCADALGAEKGICSGINDGRGFIECSHGTIPVPVPAVMAMRKDCGLVFTTDESVSTEMVTPSGLAILIGLGASYSKETPQGKLLKKAVVYGKRVTGRDGGLTVSLLSL